MKTHITEAIEIALDSYVSALGNDSYKEQCRSTHFKPILIEYERIGKMYYDSKVNESIEEIYRSYLANNLF